MNDEELVKQTFDAVWKTVIERNVKKVSPKADKAEIFFRNEEGKNELIYSSESGKKFNVKSLERKIGATALEKSAGRNSYETGR